MSDLRSWRATSGRTFTWLAGEVGTSQSFISEIAAGAKRPGPRLALAIFDTTGLQLGVLGGLNKKEVELMRRIHGAEAA